MAYNNSNNYDNDGEESSKFNAGILGTKRIHDLITNINSFSRNPQAFNMEHQDYNYNLLLRELHTLQKEFAIAKKEDKDKATDFYYRLKALLEKYPLYDNKKTMKPNQNWKIFEKAFDKYHDMVITMGTKQGYLTAFQDSDNEATGDEKEAMEMMMKLAKEAEDAK